MAVKGEGSAPVLMAWALWRERFHLFRIPLLSVPGGQYCRRVPSDQKLSASSAITVSAPDWMRARCMVVAGRRRAM